MQKIAVFIGGFLLSILSVEAFEGASAFTPSLGEVLTDVYTKNAQSPGKDEEQKGIQEDDLSETGIKQLAYVAQQRLPRSAKSFLHLGSRNGRVVLGVYLQGEGFDKCVGIENAAAQSKDAQRAYERLKKDFAPMINRKRSVLFRNEDIQKVSFGEFNVVFLSSSLSKLQRESLFMRMERELPENAIVITTQTFSPHKESHLKLEGTVALQTVGGKRLKVDIYEKTSGKNDQEPIG